MNIFQDISIRKMILIYFVFSILSTNFKTFSSEFALMVRMIFMLLWFRYEFKNKEIKITDLFKNFTILVNWKEVFLILAVLICFKVGILETIKYIIYQMELEQSKGIINGVNHETTMLAQISSILTICLLGPIVEEMAFRGVILNRLIIKFGVNIGIIGSACLFALMHPPIQYIGIFIDSIILSIFYLRSKSIIVPIVLHLLNNSVATLLDFVLLNLQSTDLTVGNSDLLIGLILFILTTVYIVKYIKKNWPPRDFKLTKLGI